MLKTYDELLDIAQSIGLSVLEDIPLAGNQRGLIHVNTVLLNKDLTENGKRAVLSEEILHFQRDSGNILRDERRELRTHKRLIERTVSFEEMLDAIITLGYNANYYSIAELLEIPEWLCREAYEYYGSLPLRDQTYRGYTIQFNPLRVIPEDIA